MHLRRERLFPPYLEHHLFHVTKKEKSLAAFQEIAAVAAVIILPLFFFSFSFFFSFFLFNIVITFTLVLVCVIAPPPSNV